MPEGEGAEAWKAFSEHYRPPRGMSACSGRSSCMTSGSSPISSIGSNSSGRRYEEQSGESVVYNVRQAVFQAGIKDAPIRTIWLSMWARLNSFHKMAMEVSTVARTRNENDIVSTDVSVLKGRGGKGKGRQGQRRQ